MLESDYYGYTNNIYEQNIYLREYMKVQKVRTSDYRRVR